MTNYELIEEFIRGEKKANCYCHLGYKDNYIVNYSKVIAVIDRDKKTADFNNRKYSRTTTNIQNTLRSLLEQYDYTITDYDGGACQWWNFGYVGAERLTMQDVNKW